MTSTRRSLRAAASTVCQLARRGRVMVLVYNGLAKHDVLLRRFTKCVKCSEYTIFATPFTKLFVMISYNIGLYSGCLGVQTATIWQYLE